MDKLQQSLYDAFSVQIKDALKKDDKNMLCNNMYNVLEQVTTEKYSEIKTIKSKLINLGAQAALMTGSGSAVFGLFYDESISSQWVSDSSKLFSSSHHGNMFAIFRTASDINWFDYSEFLNIRNEMMKLMENSNIEIIRRNRMCDVVEERVAELREHQIRLINKQMHHETLDDIIGSIDDNNAVNTDIIPNGLEDER